MDKIQIFYDKEETKQVGDIIEFEPVAAGGVETKNLFIRSLIEYAIDIDIEITGDIHKKVVEQIEPKGRIVLNLEVAPDKNILKPIQADMEINTRCLIR